RVEGKLDGPVRVAPAKVPGLGAGSQGHMDRQVAVDAPAPPPRLLAGSVDARPADLPPTPPLRRRPELQPNLLHRLAHHATEIAGLLYSSTRTMRWFATASPSPAPGLPPAIQPRRGLTPRKGRLPAPWRDAMGHEWQGSPTLAAKQTSEPLR